MRPIHLLQLGIAILMLTSATQVDAVLNLNASIAVPGDATSGNATGEQLVLATGSASSCSVPKSSPSVAPTGNDRATNQHLLVNNGPQRCVSVALTRTATSEPLVVTYYLSDGTNTETLSTRSQYLADTGAGDGTTTVSFIAPAFAVITAVVQRKNISATASAITYTLTSADLNPGSTGVFALDSTDALISGRLNRDGIVITQAQCQQAQNKSHPALLDSGNTYRYRDHTLFNNGPSRCVYVGVVRTTDVCPVYVTAYAGNAPSNNLTPSANYLGDPGGSTLYQVAKFWAPQNSPIIVRVQQIQTSSPSCTSNYTLTAPGLESVASPVPACTMDIDDDGTYSTMTDGLLLSRVLLGMTGSAVTSGAIGAGATRTTWTEIRDFLRNACFMTVAD